MNRTWMLLLVAALIGFAWLNLEVSDPHGRTAAMRTDDAAPASDDNSLIDSTAASRSKPRSRISAGVLTVIHAGHKAGHRLGRTAVRLCPATPGGIWRDVAEVQGRFPIADPGEYRLEVRSVGLLTHRSHLQVRAGSSFRVVLRPAASLTLLVRDNRGQPVAGVRAAIAAKEQAFAAPIVGEQPSGVEDSRKQQNLASLNPAFGEKLAHQKTSNARGEITWQSLPAFLDYRYAVLSGHAVVCMPTGDKDRPNISGNIHLQPGANRFRVNVRGGGIRGILPLGSDVTDARVTLFRIRSSPQTTTRRRRVCFAAGRIFEEVRVARPHLPGADGAFCFGGIKAGEYCVRAHWRNKDGHTFAARFAHLLDDHTFLDLGSMDPIEGQPVAVQARFVDETSRTPLSPTALGKMAVLIHVNAGSDFQEAVDLRNWIDGQLTLHPGETTMLRGLPNTVVQLQPKVVTGASKDRWHHDRRSQVAVLVPARRGRPTQPSILEVKLTRMVRVGVTTRIPAGASPKRALLILASADGRALRSAMRFNKTTGTLRNEVLVPRGDYSAYVRVECNKRVLAAVQGLQPRAPSDPAIQLELAPAKRRTFRVKGQAVAGKTVEFAPTGFPVSIDGASVSKAGDLTVRGVPDHVGVAFRNLPEGASIRRVEISDCSADALPQTGSRQLQRRR